MLLPISDTGSQDREWTSRAEWQTFASGLTAAGAQSVAAVKSCDKEAIQKAGDDLVEVCEGRHKVFKPEVPTGKMYGELRYPLEVTKP